MNTPAKIKDITIVSLSSGVLGESFVKHELDTGLKRLESYGINVHFSKHALRGMEFLANHPEKKAEDLLAALNSDTDMILCAIGGVDSYRMLPYLFDNNELQSVAANLQNSNINFATGAEEFSISEGNEQITVSTAPAQSVTSSCNLKDDAQPALSTDTIPDKIFLGFSDTTMNHFMFHKVGINTFYGQAFLPDICDIGDEMLPYTRSYLEELLTTGRIEKVTPSEVWNETREDFGIEAIGTAMPAHPNQGFELLQGAPVFEGEILGGCIETMFDIFDNTRHSDSPAVCEKYSLFPSSDDWNGKILLIESSEEKSEPEKYRQMIKTLKATGVFEVVNGVLMGKPDNEKYFSEYKQILLEEIDDPNLPVVANINIGHATPRCIIPFGVPTKVDVCNQIITFKYL